MIILQHGNPSSEATIQQQRLGTGWIKDEAGWKGSAGLRQLDPTRHPDVPSVESIEKIAILIPQVRHALSPTTSVAKPEFSSALIKVYTIAHLNNALTAIYWFPPEIGDKFG